MYKSLTSNQKQILEKEFSFYKSLSKKHQKQFRHRVASFIDDKEFVGRSGEIVTLEMQTLIAAVGCMLSFGRKEYLYDMIETIIIYPDEFYSSNNDAYHKGEFNPRLKVLVLSWKHFKDGYEVDNDNYNLGLHEFMHAMHLETRISKHIDGMRFKRHFHHIMARIADKDVRQKLDDKQFFRAYAFTNQFEFMAVITEYFFESPKDFKQHYPILYDHVNKALNMQIAGF
ncbi:hypothetical protein SCB49_03529 [unidentified eubacterium SCB49]|nr:hypothetical protein SCB49_03529 [unidentified eubacterium SCB49]